MGFNGTHKMADHVPQDNIVQGGDVFDMSVDLDGKVIEGSWRAGDYQFLQDFPVLGWYRCSKCCPLHDTR